MLPAERHHRILARAIQDGTVRTAELARDFAVAEETIRRDLDLLATKGRLSRTHGGAINPARQLDELSHHERAALQGKEKAAIARSAAALIEPGETVLIDASSSALALAAVIPDGIRLVTYSLAVIERLSHRADVEIVQLGGTFEPRGRRFSGILTESALRALRIDRFFFSGGGFDLAKGISDPNPDQARLKELMLAHSAWSCALIDHTKIGQCTDWFFAREGDFESLVTNQAARPLLPPKTRLPFSLRVAS